MLETLEKKIIRCLQEDLPLTGRPFADVAKKIGISEEKLLERVNMLKAQGLLRRFGANLNHRRAGYEANVMVAWYVPEERLEKAGKAMAAFKEISHCYQRRVSRTWRYNLFTMIHGKTQEECQKTIERLVDNVGTKDYIVLATRKEYKKTSPTYF